MKMLITGATGYIGSMLARYIINTYEDIELAALVRNADKARRMLPFSVRLIRADITDDSAMADVSESFDYLVHTAAQTRSYEMKAHPAETAAGIVNGTENVLHLAERCGVKSMVYLSSMEVYGDIDCSDGHRVSEAEQGYIDPLEARSCYPMGKRMAENICFDHFAEYGVPVRIARLAQTFGSGVASEETRVFAQFASAAREGRDIVLHTAGDTMGNYCDIHDTLRAIMLILQKGRAGEAYNIVNEENTMTVRQMAELVARDVANGGIGVKYDIPADNIYGYAARTGIRLSAAKLMNLGWKPQKSLAEMYRDML